MLSSATCSRALGAPCPAPPSGSCHVREAAVAAGRRRGCRRHAGLRGTKRSSAIPAGEGDALPRCGLLALGAARPRPQGGQGTCGQRRCGAPGSSRSLYPLSVQGQGDKLFSMLDTNMGKPTWRGECLEPASPSRKPKLCRLPHCGKATDWVVPLPRQRAGNTCFLPATVLGNLSPQQPRYGSQTSRLQAALAPPLGRN